jgi:retron-type reverse transcriptase
MTILLDKILDRQNMYQALKSVCSNKGTSGVDGITIDETDGYIRANWKRIKVEIEERHYKPQPVLRVEIPKPDGGARRLGIPTVMDRIIQQAIVQVLSSMVDEEFSPQGTL